MSAMTMAGRKRAAWFQRKASLVTVMLVVISGAQMMDAALIRARARAGTWSVLKKGSDLQIAYGSGVNFPQYAVLHLKSGYFRMVNNPTAGWGTSVVMLPALWSQASCRTDYCQGAPVTVTWKKSGAKLLLTLRGRIATLRVAVHVTLAPPTRNKLVAQVSTKVTGSVKLDDRPGEAFKPVMLSSVHDSSTIWDSRDAFAGTHVYQFPSNGWIIEPPVTADTFGLQGGTSNWKRNAPTIEVVLNHRQQVTGWVTADANPNDDNVAFWCATNKVLPSWNFTVTAKAGNQL